MATAAPRRHSWLKGSNAAAADSVIDTGDDEKDGEREADGAATKACGELSAASARASSGSGKGSTKAAFESIDWAMLSIPLRSLGPRRKSKLDTMTEPNSGSGIGNDV